MIKRIDRAKELIDQQKKLHAMKQQIDEFIDANPMEISLQGYRAGFRDKLIIPKDNALGMIPTIKLRKALAEIQEELIKCLEEINEEFEKI